MTTLSQTPTRIALQLVGALALTAGLFNVTAANAQGREPAFRIELADQAKTDRFITKGAAFSCDGNVCTGTESASASRHVCTLVAREQGTIVSFTRNGEAFDQAKLAACNGEQGAMMAQR